jgi:hypothetical protein
MRHHIHPESLAPSHCLDFELFGIAMATKRLRSIGEAVAWRNHFGTGCGKGIRNRIRTTATCVSKPYCCLSLAAWRKDLLEIALKKHGAINALHARDHRPYVRPRDDLANPQPA